MTYCNLKKVLFILCAGILLSSSVSAATSTDAKLQYNKGIDYYQLGQFEEAANCFKQAVNLDPNYIDAYYNLGSILEYLKQDEAALAVFKQIVLRKPTDYEAVYKAAEITQRLGDPQKAKIYLSIIPQDSLVGQKAKQLSEKVDNEIALAKESEQEQKSDLNEEEDSNNIIRNATQDKQISFEQEQSFNKQRKEPEITNEIYGNIPSPTGVAVDNDGNIFVAGYSNNTIFKIGPDKNMIVFIKSTQIDGPIGIAIDSDSNLYIANYNKNNIIKVDKNGEISELLANVVNPYCMYIKDNVLFVSSQGTNSVLRYKLK